MTATLLGCADDVERIEPIDPAPATAGAPSIRAVAPLVATSNTTSMVITKPVGTLPNDVLVAFVSVQGAPCAVVAPAGWTAIPNTHFVSAPTDVAIQGYFRVAGTSEPNAYTFTESGSACTYDMTGIMAAVSGADTRSPIHISNGQANGTHSTSCTAPSVTTSVASSLLLFATSTNGASTFTPPSGMTQQGSIASSGTYKIGTELAAATQTNAGATGTKVATSSASTDNVAVLVAIAPAPVVAPASAPSIRAVAPFVATTNTTSMVVSRPAGTLQNDVLVAFVSVQGAPCTVAAPAGWTAIPNTHFVSAPTDVVIQGYFRIAGSSEPSTYTFTETGGACTYDMTGVMLAVTGADTTSPISISNGQANGTHSTSCTAPSVTTSVANSLLVFATSTNGTSTFTAPSGMTSRGSIASSGTYKIATALASGIQPTAGATGTKVATSSASTDNVAVLVAIAPAPGTVPGTSPLSCVTTGPQYYVSTSGSDSTGNGTSGSPWRSIGHAVGAAGAGATVHVAAGTYTEQVQGHTSGTSSARICFISDTKWGAKLVGTNAGNAGAWEESASFVDIQDFDVTNPGNLGIFVNGSNVRLIGNHVHDVPGGACDSNGGAGILFYQGGGSNNDALGNWVHDVGRLGTLCQKVHGIYVGSPGGRLWNNVAYRNVGWGIHLWHEAASVTISGNTVFNNNYGGILIGAGDCSTSCTDDFTIVSDNIVYKNGLASGASGYGIEEYGSTGTHNQYLHNLVDLNGPANWRLQNGNTDSGSVTADPLFVHYTGDGSGDYHLQPTSPAVNAGTSTGAPNNDFDGVARPQGGGWDIGAFEWH